MVYAPWSVVKVVLLSGLSPIKIFFPLKEGRGKKGSSGETNNGAGMQDRMTAGNGWQAVCGDGYLRGEVWVLRNLQKVRTTFHTIAKTFLDKLEHPF